MALFDGGVQLWGPYSGPYHADPRVDHQRHHCQPTDDEAPESAGFVCFRPEHSQKINANGRATWDAADDQDQLQNAPKWLHHKAHADTVHPKQDYDYSHD